MADHHLTFSEVISQLTEQEEQWLSDYLQSPTEEQFDRWPKDKQQVWLNEHGVDDVYDWPGFQYQIGRGDCGRRLWLYAEDSGNIETVATVMQAFLKRFRRDDFFALTYATTCSKLRAGEFGGGAMFVTAERVEHIDSYGWVEEKTEHWRRIKGAQQAVS